jgi:hypothetical protein
VSESKAVAHVTSGGAKVVRVVVRGDGGAAAVLDNGSAPAVMAEPHNRVRVQGLVVGFIVNGLEEVGGGGSGRGIG